NPGLYGGDDHPTQPPPRRGRTRHNSHLPAPPARPAPPPPALRAAVPGGAPPHPGPGAAAWAAAPAREPRAPRGVLSAARALRTVTEEPYALTWNSASVANGRHVLAVRAVGEDGRVAFASVVVYTSNTAPPPPVVTSIGLDDGATVSGTVQLTPLLAGGAVN